jgi:hypothetical protein
MDIAARGQGSGLLYSPRTNPGVRNEAGIET